MHKESSVLNTPNALPLSLSSSSVNPLKVSASFVLAKRLGYDGVEVMVTPDKNSQTGSFIKALSDKHEIAVTSIHAPTLLACQFVWGTNPEYKLHKTVDLAKEVGATSIVVHPPFAKNPYAKRFLQVITDLEEDSGLNIAVENMFPWSARSKQFEIYGPSWEETTENVKSLTLDFSHAAAGGLDVIDVAKKHHAQIKVIHLCDGTVRSKLKGDPIIDEHLLPGQGQMPIKDVYAILKEVGWQGSTVLEVNTRSKKTILDKIEPLRTSLDFFRSL